jgi:tetratricopeptide (TPR) repeat protein
MEQALPLMKEARGEECAEVANYYGNIGGIYRLLGDREKCLEYNQTSLDMYLRLPNTTDTERTRSYGNVGLAAMELGNYEEGKAALLKGLAAGRLLEGKDRGELFLIYNNLGQYYQIMKQLDKAYCMYDSARVEAESLYGQRHPHTAIAMINTATTLIGQGNYEKGFDTMLKATDIYQSLVGENNLTVMTCYNNLAVISEYLKRPADQLTYAQKAAKIAEALNEPGSIALASPYHTLGSAYWKMEEADSARAYYEKAETITRTAGKGQEELLAHSLNDIGTVYVKKQEYMKAMDYFGEAMNVFATMRGRGGESNMKKIATTVSNTYDIATKEKMAKKPLRQKVKELKAAYPECFTSVK